LENYNIILKLISRFEKATGLIFINENEAEGNVCYANDAVLRSEYKTTFTEKDIKNYILGLSQTQNTQNITLPKDAETFWEIVDMGRVC
jgi:hypothetical protein